MTYLFSNIDIIIFVGFLVISLLKKSSWLVKIKETISFSSLKIKYIIKITNLYNSIKKFDLLKSCKDNLPLNESTYAYLGLFMIIVNYSSAYTIPQQIILQNIDLYNFIHHTSLIIATCFLTYPIWPTTYKNKNYISLLWIIGIFYILVFSSSLLVIMSHFTELQIIIFMVNLIIVVTLLKWPITLIATMAGIFASSNFYKCYNHVNALPKSDLQFKIIYTIILFVSSLIIFLRPKQKYQELIEAKNTHLGRQVYDREEELQKLLDLKYEFLRNINHEIHTPMTGITSLGETLWAKYDRLSEVQRRRSVEVIVKSSRRLNSFVNNILDLSKLSSLTYNLNKQRINFSKLIYERVNICRKLYQGVKNLEFLFNIEDDVNINCDQYYISQTLDNLIINSITYTDKGKVTISLHKTPQELKFAILDDGIGVPTEELHDIFGVFVVSSKTRNPAGGRGVGLALCKKVIEVHGGKIWAENNEDNKTMMIFTMILNQETVIMGNMTSAGQIRH